MYIQSRRDPSVKLTSPYPRLIAIKEVTRFITSATGEPQFTAWSNDEIRLKSSPSESDLRSYKIDLSHGFEQYWSQHLKDVHAPIAHHHPHHHPLRSSASQSHLNQRLNHNHQHHHMSSLNLSHLGRNVHHPGMEKDDVNRKTFEATLKWLKKAGYFCNSDKKPKLVTTSSALYLLLQLPYEKDEKSHTCWLVSKYKDTLFVSSIENYTNPVTSNGHNNNNNNHHRYSSNHVHNNHSNNFDALESDRAAELTKYRWRLFNNLMTEQDSIENVHNKPNRCVLNSAMFNGHKLMYSATINAVNEFDQFVDVRLGVPQRNRREHLIKLQKLWAIAVVKPAVDIVLGTRSTKTPNNNSNGADGTHISPQAPEGRLIKVDKINVKRIPAEVYEYSMKSCSSPCSEAQGLWNPRICFDFLKRVIEFLDHRCVDDPNTVYQLTPEGFFGRGFSVLQIHKVNTQGCDPLIPEWFVEEDDDEEEEDVYEDEDEQLQEETLLDTSNVTDGSADTSDAQEEEEEEEERQQVQIEKIETTQVQTEQLKQFTNGHTRQSEHPKEELEEGITEITVEEELSYYVNCYLINED